MSTINAYNIGLQKLTDR